MAGVGVVRPQNLVLHQDFPLESGAILKGINITYETMGELNRTRDNVVLLLHALTGSAHVAGLEKPGGRATGWWDPLIGPGRTMDTERYFVICSNVLGGCYGTTGPVSINPSTGSPYGMNFPVVTIRDMVRLQRVLLDHLGITGLVTAIGGSMGGMQALEWAATYPDFVRSVIPIATSARMSALGIAYNQVQREAIFLDPNWRKGDYYGTPGPKKGLSLARMIGTITYKSDESFTMKFGRAFAGQTVREIYDFDSRFEVENYLRYQGDKLVERFDANSYLLLTKAMDLHDIAQGYGSLREAFARVSCKLLLIGISSDTLYPVGHMKEITAMLRKQGKDASYVELQSPFGHDAFLIEFKVLNPIIKGFMETM